MIKKTPLQRLVQKNLIGIIIIVVVTAVIRLFNYPNGYVFDSDATRDAIIALEGVRHPYFPFVGAFSSTGPFTFGPWYYLSLMIVEFFLRTPYAPWLLITVSSFITIVVMFDTGRLIYSKTFGYLLALFTALAPAEFIASTSLSNLSPVSLFAALSLWSSTRILTAEKPKMFWYIALGIFIGLGINAHYQTAGLLILPILVWWFSPAKTLKTALAIGFGVFLTFIPLLIFNLTHNWHTIRGIVEMYNSRSHIYVANSWTLYLEHFWPSLMQFIFGTPLLINIIMLLVVPIVLLWDAAKRTLPQAVGIATVVFLINFISLRFYWGERSFVYHYFLVPFILLLVSYSIYRLSSLMSYGFILSTLIGVSILLNMLMFVYNRDMSYLISPNPTLSMINIIVSKYPTSSINIYKCDKDTTSLADSIVYLLQFEHLPANGIPVKLAVGGAGECSYPKRTMTYGWFADISKVPSKALKKASWTEITTEIIFNKSQKWY